MAHAWAASKKAGEAGGGAGTGGGGGGGGGDTTADSRPGDVAMVEDVASSS
jgi:hypothetical protein